MVMREIQMTVVKFGAVDGADLMLLSVLERLVIEEDVAMFDVFLGFKSMIGDSVVVG